MPVLNRRSVAISLLGALACTRGLQAAHAGAGASQTLEDMVSALQGHSVMSFAVEMKTRAAPATAGRRSLGSSVHVVFERRGRLLASYGGPLDLRLLITPGEATLYCPPKKLKSVLKPVTGGSAFAVPGLFLPFLGLLDQDVKRSLFGDIQSVAPLAEGAPEQPEETDLVVVMSALFTGEIWIRKSEPAPARLIGTFIDGAGGGAESAGLTFSDWSAHPLADDAFDLPGLDAAQEVQLADMNL